MRGLEERVAVKISPNDLLTVKPPDDARSVEHEEHNGCYRRTACRRDEERDDICIESHLACVVAHYEDGDRVGAQASEYRCSDDLADHRERDLLELLIKKARQERAEHTAREGQHAAEARHNADEARQECDGHRVPGTQKDRADDVYEMLHRSTSAAKNGKREYTSDNGNGDHDAG